MKTRFLSLLLVIMCTCSISACNAIKRPRQTTKRGNLWAKEKGVSVPCDCGYDSAARRIYGCSSGNFTILTIKLYKGLYIIYAQKGDSIYKIYSTKERNVPSGGKRLRVDSTYYLSLCPLIGNMMLPSNKLHVVRHFNGYPVTLMNVYRRYCMFDIYSADNIVSAHAYDSNKCFDFVTTHKRGTYKRFKEPKIELPPAWDSLPEIRARQSK